MFATALVLLVPLLAHLSAAQSQTCSRSYTVQQGDICDGISAANNVSTFQLAVVNSGTIDPECNNLNPGSTICLGWAGEDCTTTYVVRLGDTCDEVSASWNLNMTILYANNPQLNEDCTNLYVGEVICTSSTVAVPPLPASGTVPASAVPPTATPASTDLPWCD